MTARKVHVLPPTEWRDEFSTWIAKAAQPQITYPKPYEPTLGMFVWFGAQRPVEARS